MNNERYEKLAKNLVREKFPTLKKSGIKIINLKNDFSGAAIYLPFIRVIAINYKRFDKADEDVVIGLLAHELCHFEIFKKIGWWNYFVYGFKYWVLASDKWRTKSENEVDKLVIEKGYAKQLYEVKKFTNKNRKSKKYKNFKQYYLSAVEIKDYAIKIKKWNGK